MILDDIKTHATVIFLFRASLVIEKTIKSEVSTKGRLNKNRQVTVETHHKRSIPDLVSYNPCVLS